MNFEYLISRLHKDKRIRIGAHAFFWLGELFLNWYSTTISFNTYNKMGDQFIWQLAIVNTLNLMLVYYPLIYAIIPILKARRYISGIFGIAFLLITYSLGSVLSEKAVLLNCSHCMALLKENKDGYYYFLHRDWLNRFFAKLASMGVLISLVFSISVPVAIKIALGSFRQQLAAVQLAKENVELEFNFLKSQVNPHFLFNALNNIYGLILKKETTIAAETVARLAEFMRYTLHCPESDRMPVQKEVRLLADYIDLEKIRLNHTAVNFELVDEGEKHFLPSLLFMPLIENAFKYSADQSGAAIDIKLSLSTNTLQLDISNTIDPNRQLSAAGGIGLQNLKKRLELYYPGNYRYEAIDTDLYYTAKLRIKL